MEGGGTFSTAIDIVIENALSPNINNVTAARGHGSCIHYNQWVNQ